MVHSNYEPAMCLLNCEEPGTGMPSLADISYGRFNESGTRPMWFDLAVSVAFGVPKNVQVTKLNHETRVI